MARLASEVLETVIRPALLTQEEMRRNPAGAVGRFLSTENSRPVQEAIQDWKRAQLAVEQGNPDPALANVERFRPSMGAGTFMANAQIPGHFAMTPQAKANWPADMPAEGTVDTPLKQVRKRERSEAQVAALARAREARIAQRAAIKDQP